MSNTFACSEPRLHLFARNWDFLLLGGGSIAALIIIRTAFEFAFKAEGAAISFGVTLFLANLINHPHFAHSYQIFYNDYLRKLFSSEYAFDLRIRYLLCGLILPTVLLGALSGAIYFEKPRILGLAANAMFFLVGWHYVKQGFGMAMVDAALKKRFFCAEEKSALLHNAYATWILSWLYINYLAKGKSHEYFGVPYYEVPIEGWMCVAAALFAAITLLRVVALMFRRQQSGKLLAWNGLVAYLVSLYAWLLIRDPIVILWVPLFHSLQYLAVVWRFKWNQIEADRRASVKSSYRFGLFCVCGLALGYFMFWAVPTWLTESINYRRDLFGPFVFSYVTWIFINIHHYFLDTVMWRKGNPDVAANLFGVPTR